MIGAEDDSPSVAQLDDHGLQACPVEYARPTNDEIQWGLRCA
jgi:hypothetical protein